MRTFQPSTSQGQTEKVQDCNNDCAALERFRIICRPLQLSHVASITERIHINGEPISEEEFAENVGSALSLAELHLEFSPSWFELVTAIAFRSFADAAVDVAVIEVGMLGRYDATNIGNPRVSVITNVDYDHTDGAEGWREK